jgi:phenylacetate-CoA oxygenase PaaI subunit
MPSDTTSPAAREALFSLVARLADNKYFLGRHYAEWCSGAPTLESAVAAAAMAQDELGHARALYPLLRTLAPDAGPEIEPETRTRFLRTSFLDTPFYGWEDFVAANFLLDGALTTIFAAARDSSYEPLAGRARKVMQEERMHALHGEAWVRRLAQAGGAVRDACEASLRRAWGETLCWFGPSGADDPLSATGILDASPDALRTRFLAAVGPTIEAAGLALPVRRSCDGWELSVPLPWDRWNPSTYRLDGAGEPAAQVPRSRTPETRPQQASS